MNLLILTLPSIFVYLHIFNIIYKVIFVFFCYFAFNPGIALTLTFQPFCSAFNVSTSHSLPSIPLPTPGTSICSKSVLIFRDIIFVQGYSKKFLPITPSIDIFSHLTMVFRIKASHQQTGLSNIRLGIRHNNIISIIICTFDLQLDFPLLFPN